MSVWQLKWSTNMEIDILNFDYHDTSLDVWGEQKCRRKRSWSKFNIYCLFVTVMATVSTDAFSRKTLFLLESHISINQAKYFWILLIEDMFHKLQILKFKLCYVKVFHSDGLLPVLMPTNTRHWFWIIAAVIATLNLYWCHLLFSFSSLYGVVSVETQIYRLPYCKYLSIQVLKEYGR